MRRLLATFVALTAGARLASAEIPDTYTPPGTNPATATPPASVETSHVPVAANPGAPKPSTTKPAKPAARTVPTSQAMAEMQTTLDQVTKSNHDLLDLLKQQQAVLEDIQYDRRLQSRQIESLEARLEESLDEKEKLQKKIDSLEMQASVRPAIADNGPAAPPSPVPHAPPDKNPPDAPVITSVQDTNAPSATPPDAPDPTPPASYLPPEGSDNPPGQQWQRIFTLKGNDNRQTDVFTIHGKVWRVLWHNQDKAGKLYANTSALFVNAYPRDDTIPTKVCSKLGTGGDSIEMRGAGNYYLKIEASGGSWELAVEDLR